MVRAKEVSRAKPKVKAKAVAAPRKTAADLERRAKDARSLRSKRVVLKAATDLFVEKGYAGFSVNVIVLKTGISKTTIYRHWPTQNHLLTDVLAALGKGLEIPDRGNVRDDLLAFYREQSHSIYNDRKNSALLSIGSLLETAEHDPGLVHVVNFVFNALLSALRVILERGKLRGEVRVDSNLDTMIYLVYGAMYARRSILNEETSDAQIVEMVDLALNGIRPR